MNLLALERRKGGLDILMPCYDDATPLDKLRKQLDLQQLATAGRDLAHALYKVHRLRVVHRDVKPENALRVQVPTAAPTVRHMYVLIDLELARPYDTEMGNGITMPSVVPTKPYAAPEEQGGNPATAAGDVYRLGMSLLFLLTRGELNVRVGATVEQATEMLDRANASRRTVTRDRLALAGDLPDDVCDRLFVALKDVILSAMEYDKSQRPPAFTIYRRLEQCLTAAPRPPVTDELIVPCNLGPTAGYVTLRAYLKSTTLVQARKTKANVYFNSIVGQLTTALQRLHAEGSIHGHLNPDTVFVKKTLEGTLALQIMDCRCNGGACHKARFRADAPDGYYDVYRAPELRLLQFALPENDYWSVGMIVLKYASGADEVGAAAKTLSGVYPFSGQKNFPARWVPMIEVHEDVTAFDVAQYFIKLAEPMLEVNPSKRTMPF